MTKATKERIRANAIGRKDAQSARHRLMRREWRFQALQARKAMLRDLGVVLPLVPRRVNADDVWRFEGTTALAGLHFVAVST